MKTESSRVLRWTFEERKDRLVRKISCFETLSARTKGRGENHREVVVGLLCLIGVDFSMNLKL